LYADRASKDEQHCMRMFFVEKDEKASADWMLQFVICFMETTHEPLQLDKWSLI
jgi:hypothetical protein